jgi:hypothetical protein
MHFCRQCNSKLIENQNWSLGRKKVSDYICKSCKRAYMQEYFSKNREEIKAQRWTFRRQNIGKILYQRIKAKCKKNNIPFNLEETDIIVPSICPVFGFPLIVGREDHYNSPSLDRIDPNKGYIKGNIEVISMKANMIKNSATPEELSIVAKYYQLNNFV